MQLWLCLRLSELAVQCLPQQRPHPVAVLEQQRIHTVNAAASLLGLEPGMDPATARALAGEHSLQLLARDSRTENDALESLCCWAYGITPHLYRFREDCLMLEISGSLRLFGGAEAILRHCQRGLACRGFSARTALAPTALAAWGLSFCDDSQDASEATINLPLGERLQNRRLGLFSALHAQFGALERSGIRSMGELFAMPAAAIARRCGADFGELLQHISGQINVPPVHFEPPSCFIDNYPLGYPVSNHTELGPALQHLLESLERYLRQRQLHTRQLCWHFLGINGYSEVLEVRASDPSTPRQDWYRLTGLRLERQPFRDEVERVQLRVSQLEPAQVQSGHLFRQTGQTGSTRQLVDLLSNRLGQKAVNSLLCRDAHLPEHSSAIVEPGGDRKQAASTGAQRPFWLLPEPELLRREREQLLFWGKPLELIHGPERIEDGWWEKATSRDYFVARNDQGQRFWVFHERRQRRWYLHGLFS